MHCPGGSTTERIWRGLASSDGISPWTPLKPQHNNSNPNLLTNQLGCIDFLAPPTPLIIPHRLHGFLESLVPLKNWYSIHASCSKSSLKHSISFCGIFLSLNQNFIAYRSFKVSDCIFENHQLSQSGFSRVYSNCCCSCSFEPEIIKIGQSSDKMYSNNILNSQESTPILNACIKKKVLEIIEGTTWLILCWNDWFYTLRVFHASVRWLYISEVWVTPSLLKTSWRFSLFWSILMMLLAGWSPVVLWFLILPILLTNFWEMIPSFAITTGFNSTFMFYCVFSSLAISRY